jgi:Glycosyl transferases group 1
MMAGGAHLERFEGVCRAVDVREQDWSSEPAPHLLLIESSGLRQRPTGGGPISDEKVERALELVAWSESHQIPTAFWETSLKRRIDTPLSLLGKVDHLFVADPEAAPVLTEQLEGRRPMQLPLAAQVIPDRPPSFEEREHDVAFLGRWPLGASGRLQAELETILDVARASDLIIFQRERDIDTDELPDRFASFVEPVRSAQKAIESFQDSRVVIGFDLRNSGRLWVPQVSFDALASGGAVLVPNHAGIRRLLRYSVVVAKNREEAEAAMERMLGNEDEWSNFSRLGRRAILNAHAYTHRLATIASAVGFRLLPERPPGVSAP